MTRPPQPEPSRADADLIARAQRGDAGAFEELYRTTVGRVYAVCLRLCGDAAVAEELTQESFVRAWEKLASFRGHSAFSTWMHRLAVNVALGHGRRSARRPEPSQLGEEPRLADKAPTHGQNEQALDLERAIGALPDRARSVFVLHDVEGYRHEEIAGLTGIAVGTSRAHLHRARRLLREALSP